MAQESFYCESPETGYQWALKKEDGSLLNLQTFQPMPKDSKVLASSKEIVAHRTYVVPPSIILLGFRIMKLRNDEVDIAEAHLCSQFAIYTFRSCINEKDNWFYAHLLDDQNRSMPPLVITEKGDFTLLISFPQDDGSDHNIRRIQAITSARGDNHSNIIKYITLSEL